MRFLLQLPVVRTLHQRGLLFVAVLLLVVGGVLVRGALQPEVSSEAPLFPEPELEPPSLLNLRPDLEKTPLTYLSDYWEQLGDRVRGKLVLVGSERIPAVVVEPGLLLTSLRAAEELLEHPAPEDAESTAETPTEGEPTTPDESPEASEEPPPVVVDVRPYSLVSLDVDLEMALLALREPNPGGYFLRVSPRTASPGSFAAAVSLTSQGGLSVTPGHLASAGLGPSSSANPDSLDLSMAFTDTTQVAAIVDLDGDLLGVAVRTSRGIDVLTSDGVAATVARLRQPHVCYSIDVAPLDPAVLELLPVDAGVMVEQVRRDAFVPEPSIRAGDILLEWGDATITETSAFEAAYREGIPGSSVSYRVLRNRRPLTERITMPNFDCRPAERRPLVFSTLGMTVQWVDGPGGVSDAAPGRWRVAAVDPGSPAETAGLQAADWIVAIGDRALDRDSGREALTRLDTRLRATLFMIRRADKTTLVAVRPPPSE